MWRERWNASCAPLRPMSEVRITQGCRVSASQNYAQRTDGYNISGNMSYRIGVK